MPILNRRHAMFGAAGLAAVAAVPRSAHGAGLTSADRLMLRGSLDATTVGVRSTTQDDQSAIFQRMLDAAGETDTPVFLPAGSYLVSGITLPRRLRLRGVPGATRLVLSGGGQMLEGVGLDFLELRDLTIDGDNRELAESARALVDIYAARHLDIANCRIVGSASSAIALERTAGRIVDCEIAGAADYGIYSVEGAGMEIRQNRLENCGNGGILVHRWTAAEDDTVVSGNRIRNMAARNGGTGQYGNGINLFRANNVSVSDNHVADCAFSAIRANGSSNIRIADNTCLRSGETAIYAEFGFDGAIVSGNLVDGAANGISIVNFNEGGRLSVCQGNLVRNLSETGPYPADPPGFGVGITVEADSAVSGNVVENAPRYGIHVGWGEFMRNVAITGNVIRKAGTGVAITVVEGTGPALVSDNLVSETERGAVVGYRWSEAVTGDLAADGAEIPASLTVARNRAV